MQKVASTRMALLQRKAQAVLAKQGGDLLERKRTALVREFMAIARRAMANARALEEAAASARLALARAEAVAGPEAVRSAALATQRGRPLELDSVSVMGVRVPSISMADHGGSQAGPATSTTIDEAAAAFESEVRAIACLAESEIRLTRLATEIRRVSRQVNALDHVLIPRLKTECDQIQMDLDERERAASFRLKLVKRALERSHGF